MYCSGAGSEAGEATIGAGHIHREAAAIAVPTQQDDGRVPLITDRTTARCADVFNVANEALLHTLQRYFAHTEETDEQLLTADALMTEYRNDTDTTVDVTGFLVHMRVSGSPSRLSS